MYKLKLNNHDSTRNRTKFNPNVLLFFLKNKAIRMNSKEGLDSCFKNDAICLASRNYAFDISVQRNVFTCFTFLFTMPRSNRIALHLKLNSMQQYFHL